MRHYDPELDTALLQLMAIGEGKAETLSQTEAIKLLGAIQTLTGQPLRSVSPWLFVLLAAEIVLAIILASILVPYILPQLVHYVQSLNL